MFSKKVNHRKKDKNSVHATTKPLMMIIRMFGIFPVSGLMSRSPYNLRYVLKSPYTLIAVFSVVGHLMLALFGLLHLRNNTVTPRNVYKCIVHLVGFLYVVLVIGLSRKWPKLIRDIASIEKSLPQFNQKNVTVKVAWIVVIISALGVVECMLSLHFYRKLSNSCVSNWTLDESHYRYTMPSTAAYIPFSRWFYYVVQVLVIQIVFLINLPDMLIIVFGLYLSSYFEELNNLILLYKNKKPNVWSALRTYYSKLTRIVKLVDDQLSVLIFFSYGSNITLICVQMFKLLKKDYAHDTSNCDPQLFVEALASASRTAYFSFSLTFRIMRALASSLCAANLQRSSRAPVQVLQDLPTACYGFEAHRFLEQVQKSTVALSGMKFFFITREMIINVVATVFTYELVLLQLSDIKHK